jgi:hypothetical protein
VGALEGGNVGVNDGLIDGLVVGGWVSVVCRRLFGVCCTWQVNVVGGCWWLAGGGW